MDRNDKEEEIYASDVDKGEGIRGVSIWARWGTSRGILPIEGKAARRMARAMTRPARKAAAGRGAGKKGTREEIQEFSKGTSQ